MSEESRNPLQSLDELQSGLGRWLIEAIGEDTLNDIQARAMRVLEEAVELAQAAGISRAKAEEQVVHTYNRPAGEVYQEIAGCINSSLLAAECLRLSGRGLGLVELDRAWDQIDVIREKQHSKVQP